MSVSSRLRAQPELLTDCSSMYKYYINEHIFWYYHVILSNDYVYVYMSTSQRRVYSAWSLAHTILTKKNAFFPVNVKVPANQRFIYPDNSFIKVSLFFSPNQIFLKIWISILWRQPRCRCMELVLYILSYTLRFLEYICSLASPLEYMYSYQDINNLEKAPSFLC